jgi:hypothetical protein
MKCFVFQIRMGNFFVPVDQIDEKFVDMANRRQNGLRWKRSSSDEGEAQAGNKSYSKQRLREAHDMK